MNGYQLQKAAAVLYTVLAAVSGLLFFRLGWAPRIDFDISGFLWVLTNAGRLTAS